MCSAPASPARRAVTRRSATSCRSSGRVRSGRVAGTEPRDPAGESPVDDGRVLHQHPHDATTPVAWSVHTLAAQPSGVPLIMNANESSRPSAVAVVPTRVDTRDSVPVLARRRRGPAWRSRRRSGPPRSR